VIFAIFTKVCRVFLPFCRDFLLSLLIREQEEEEEDKVYKVTNENATLNTVWKQPLKMKVVYNGRENCQTSQ